MSARVRVAVIGGGANCEHDVSLASAASVADALDPQRYDVVRLTIGRDGGWRLGERRLALSAAVALLESCDVAFPLVHGPHGEDGTLAALCDLAGVPFVGCDLRAGALAMDKWATKLVAEAVGVATAPGRLLTRRTAPAHAWSHPVVVKPVAAGSSQGVALVATAREWPEALAAALDLDATGQVLVEDVVAGREIDVAVLREPDGSLVCGPPLEIVVDGLFDYDAKYGGHADFRIPAALDEADRKALEDAALTVADALGCAGVVRIDFFLTDDGVVLNEVNTTPGMTAHSQVPRMFAAAGLDYAALLDRLIEGALAPSPA